MPEHSGTDEVIEIIDINKVSEIGSPAAGDSIRRDGKIDLIYFESDGAFLIFGGDLDYL